MKTIFFNSKTNKYNQISNNSFCFVIRSLILNERSDSNEDQSVNLTWRHSLPPKFAIFVLLHMLVRISSPTQHSPRIFFLWTWHFISWFCHSLLFQITGKQLLVHVCWSTLVWSSDFVILTFFAIVITWHCFFFSLATIEKSKSNELYMDKLRIEKERGITVKAQTASMFFCYKGEDYLLNLIDTPVITIIFFVWNLFLSLIDERLYSFRSWCNIGLFRVMLILHTKFLVLWQLVKELFFLLMSESFSKKNHTKFFPFWLFVFT